MAPGSPGLSLPGSPFRLGDAKHHVQRLEEAPETLPASRGLPAAGRENGQPTCWMPLVMTKRTLEHREKPWKTLGENGKTIGKP